MNCGLQMTLRARQPTSAVSPKPRTGVPLVRPPDVVCAPGSRVEFRSFPTVRQPAGPYDDVVWQSRRVRVGCQSPRGPPLPHWRGHQRPSPAHAMSKTCKQAATLAMPSRNLTRPNPRARGYVRPISTRTRLRRQPSSTIPLGRLTCAPPNQAQASATNTDKV